MQDYPLLKSFVIEVEESWTEMDLFKHAPTKRYTNLESLETAYPSRSDPQLRDYYAIDLRALLNSCYASSKPEQVKRRPYPPSGGDGKEVHFKAVCRITYKDENAAAVSSQG